MAVVLEVVICFWVLRFDASKYLIWSSPSSTCSSEISPFSSCSHDATLIVYKQVGTDYTYDKKCLIGQGSFAKVYKGWSRKRKLVVAVKKIKKVFVAKYIAILGLGLVLG